MARVLASALALALASALDGSAAFSEVDPGPCRAARLDPGPRGGGDRSPLAFSSSASMAPPVVRRWMAWMALAPESAGRAAAPASLQRALAPSAAVEASALLAAPTVSLRGWPSPGAVTPPSPGPGSAARRFHPPRDPPPWVTSFRDASRPRPFLPPQLRHGPSPSVPLGAGSSDCGGCSGAAVPVWAGFGCGPSPRPVAIWPAPGNGRLRPLPPSPVGTPVCCRRWRHSGGTGALLPSPGWDGSHRPTAGCWCPVIPAGPRDWRTTKGCVPLWRCGGAAAAAYGPPSPAAGPWRWSAPAAPHPMAWPWRAPSVWPWPGPVGRWSAVWRRASMGRPMPAA